MKGLVLEWLCIVVLVFDLFCFEVLVVGCCVLVFWFDYLFGVDYVVKGFVID